MSPTNNSSLRSSVRALMLAIGTTVLVVATGGLLAAFDGSRAHPSIDEVERQNRALRTQQEKLREQAFDLTERSVEAVRHGQRMVLMAGARGRDWEAESPPLPARDANTDTLLAWLSEERALLAKLDNELLARQAGIGGGAASAATAALDIPLGRPDRGPARQERPRPYADARGSICDTSWRSASFWR